MFLRIFQTIQPTRGFSPSVFLLEVYPFDLGLGDGESILVGTVLFEVVADDVEANGFSNCLQIQISQEIGGMYDEYQHYQYWAKGEGTVFSTLYLLISESGDITITFTSEERLITGAGIKE